MAGWPPNDSSHFVQVIGHLKDCTKSRDDERAAVLLSMLNYVSRGLQLLV